MSTCLELDHLAVFIGNTVESRSMQRTIVDSRESRVRHVLASVQPDASLCMNNPNIHNCVVTRSMLCSLCCGCTVMTEVSLFELLDTTRSVSGTQIVSYCFGKLLYHHTVHIRDLVYCNDEYSQITQTFGTPIRRIQHCTELAKSHIGTSMKQSFVECDISTGISNDSASSRTKNSRHPDRRPDFSNNTKPICSTTQRR